MPENVNAHIDRLASEFAVVAVAFNVNERNQLFWELMMRTQMKMSVLDWDAAEELGKRISRTDS